MEQNDTARIAFAIVLPIVMVLVICLRWLMFR